MLRGRPVGASVQPGLAGRRRAGDLGRSIAVSGSAAAFIRPSTQLTHPRGTFYPSGAVAPRPLENVPSGSVCTGSGACLSTKIGKPTALKKFTCLATPTASRGFTNSHTSSKLHARIPVSSALCAAVRFRHHPTTTLFVRPSSTMAESPKWTGLKVRQTFLEYFENKGHTIGEAVRLAGELNSSTSPPSDPLTLPQCRRRRSCRTMTRPSSSPTRA